MPKRRGIDVISHLPSFSRVTFPAPSAGFAFGCVRRVCDGLCDIELLLYGQRCASIVFVRLLLLLSLLLLWDD
jgi:hypothetical protein